eukprot:TRINITY_DN32654_c0_g1_i1.p1 TRINITY_DN32654_c0_g1~~TRINITY_DN32654_c0_g1_i1.p1  ORF type:complete len:482 (+),score=143.84 TRINITY_DN32654_c0_g1_i1:27-1472(+)
MESPAVLPNAAGSRAPGFFAESAEAALKQRADWFESLGAAVVLDSENLSSDESETWEEAPQAAGTRGVSIAVGGEEVVSAATAEKAGESQESKGLTGLLQAAVDKARVEYFEVDIGKARERFARAQFIEDSTLAGEGAVASLQRPEAPARRFGRLKAEITTFCNWAEEHVASASSQEAEVLRKEAKQMADDVQRATQVAAASNVGYVPAQQVWLPSNTPGPKEEVDLAMQLLALEGTEVHPEQAAGVFKDSAGSALSYSLTAPSGNGWLLAAQAEAVTRLEERLQGLGDLLGSKQETPAPSEGSESLLATTAQLSRRLEQLERIFHGPSCERLLASIRLLAADIDVAVAEAKHLEEMEAQEEREDAELARPGSASVEEDASVETTESQVLKLYEQLSGLDVTALSVEKLKQELAVQEDCRRQLEHFAADLATAEARTAVACELLRSTATVASEMRASTVACSEQLQRDVASLEAKLKALEP